MNEPSHTGAPLGETAGIRPAKRLAKLSLYCLLVSMAAFFSLIIQMKFIRIIGMGPGFEPVSVAKSLATKGTFADPFSGPTGPTAHVAPLWPFMLAGLYRAAPDEQYFRFSALLLTMLLHVLNVLLLFLLSGKLFQNPMSQLGTLALALVVPLYQVIPAEEAICVSTGLLAFWLLARRHKAVMCGMFGGLLLLLNPSLLTILVPIAIYEWKRANSIALFLAVMFLVITPWEVRNYQVFHKLFFIRDNLGLELDAYNNDCEVSGTGECNPHPVLSAAERAKVAEMGEVPYNQMRLGHVAAWFKAHPGAALGLIARRIARFWFPISGSGPFGFGITLVTAVSAWGFWCMFRNRLKLLWPMLAILVLYPPIYYLVRFDLRYRYSILWVSILAGGYGLARLMESAGFGNRQAMLPAAAAGPSQADAGR